MIAIIGHMDVDPTKRDELVAATKDLQQSTETEEPGCMVYAITADAVNPGRIRVVELWEDAATLEAHFKHPNIFATGEALRSEPRLGGGVVKYRIDASDPVKGDDGFPSATFWSTSA